MGDPHTLPGVEITGPDTELIPASGRAAAVTRLELASYYAAVAPAMAPFLRGRPLTVQRFPDGIDGPSFLEERAPGDERSLVRLAGEAGITPYAWLCTADDPDRPDQLVFELDPSVPGLAAVRRATRLVGDLLEDLGLTCYLKTTGSRGYHVLVPLRRSWTFEQVQDFAREVAEVLVERDPDLLTLETRPEQRGDRVLIDVSRNAHGRTAVPPYAVRARPRAPVSAPLRWEELSRVKPDQYTIRSIGRRLGRTGDPWKHLERRAQRLDRAQRRLHRLRAG